MVVNRYCLTSQGLQRNTLLHAVAQAIGTHSSPCSQIIDSLKQSSANNDIANRAAPATPHPTRIYTTEVHRPPRPQSPLPNTPGATSPEKNMPLRLRTRRPRPPRTGQKKQPHVPSIGIAWLRMRYAIVNGLPLAQQEPVWPRP